MCGIAGFVGLGTRADLERMTAALRHRGPDGSGLFVDEAERAFLGHRRLAIIDLAGGEQPMWNEDARVGVIFNGEIYNHVELRAELRRRGHVFASHHSDTEVLVHGYEEWGEELPLRLNGMFAFAVLDRRRRRLFLARDRFGEKPLFYCARRSGLAFASELTALALHPGTPDALDLRSVQKFFAYGYLPAPHAMLEGVRKLPGGHWLSHDIASGATVVQPYWRFRLEPDESLGDRDEPRLVEECGELLAQAARRRLMSDVPIGVFLSGGLDSSLVLASLASRGGAGKLSAFTIGFDEPSFDESAHAAAVARHLGVAHHCRILDLDRARDLIGTVLAGMDEPLGDPSLLPTYLLSAFAREQLTVALSGDGGDELFAGYDPFVALRHSTLYRRMMPRWGHRTMVRLADLLPISHGNMGLDFKLRRALGGLSHPEAVQLPVWMAPLAPKDWRELFEAPLPVEDVYDEAIALWDGGADDVDRALDFFTCLYLQDDILAKVDRAAMMSSLETRAVFLDNDLVDFVRRLPNRFKFRNGERKYILKQVARRLLPASIVDRRKKGFGIPLAKWLQDIPRELPLEPLRGLRGAYAQRSFAEHRSGRSDHRSFLWCWMAMQSFAARIGQGGALDASGGASQAGPASAAADLLGSSA